ncbi:g11486 [Coccomyxa viridis]|uniref:G11486 protein n=1 Tax=Coccomyxa viridis TaxID=1274662 RepID=A0ABP1G982_9CHLO
MPRDDLVISNDTNVSERRGRYVNKWHTLTASILLQLSAGLGYCFSLYSSQIKEHFGYSQEEIQGIGSAANLGGYLSIVSGLLYDATSDHHRWGPRATLLVGAVLNTVGYLALWASAAGRINPSYWQVVIIAMVAPFAGTFWDTSALATCTRNFPAERGTIIGIVKACMGLSGAVYTSLYVGFLQPDTLGFLIFIAVVPTAVILIAACFVNFVPFTQAKEIPAHTGLRLTRTVQLLLALAAYLLVTAVLKSTLDLSKRTCCILAVGTLLIVSLVLLVPWNTGGLWAEPSEGQQEPLLEPRGSAGGLLAEMASEDALKADQERAEAGEEQALKGAAAVPIPELSPLQCLLSVNFWLLFISFCVGCGTGLVFLNNIAQLVSALGGGGSPAVYVSVFSVSSCAGRLLLGYGPEALQHKRGVPRPVFLILISALTALVSLACAFATLPALIPAAVFAGLAFGAHWSLIPALASELFGLRFFASNYCLLQLAPALGGFALATELAGALYDRQAAAQDNHTYCKGSLCFRQAFLVCTGLCLCATAASAALYMRSRALYRQRYCRVI